VAVEVADSQVWGYMTMFMSSTVALTQLTAHSARSTPFALDSTVSYSSQGAHLGGVLRGCVCQALLLAAREGMAGPIQGCGNGTASTLVAQYSWPGSIAAVAAPCCCVALDWPLQRSQLAWNRISVQVLAQQMCATHEQYCGCNLLSGTVAATTCWAPDQVIRGVSLCGVIGVPEDLLSTS
jgi:hypothetical protein